MDHPDNLKKTPVADYDGEDVVEWLDVFGYRIPLAWGDVPAEYAAVRNHAAAMEFSMLSKFDAEGSGALETVNRINTRDVSRMTQGKIAYGCVVTDSGMMTVRSSAADRNMFGSLARIPKWANSWRTSNPIS